MDKDDGEQDKAPRGSGHSGKLVRKWLKRLFGRGAKSELSQEERDRAIEESIEQFASQISSDEIILEEDEREMIHGVVELGETSVKEVMVPRINMVGISVEMGLSEVIDIIRRSGHSRIPLYGESPDDIKGILYAKDLLSHALRGKRPDLVGVARKPYFIPAENRRSSARDEKKKASYSNRCGRVWRNVGTGDHGGYH
jgi:CBS domain containing-hemolysin-like protein